MTTDKLLVLLALYLVPATSLIAAEVPSELRSLPVQSHGRVMPFESFAREQILSVTGKLKMKGENPTESVMNWIAHSEHGFDLALFDVGFEPLKKEVGLDLKKRFFNLDDLFSQRKIMQLGAASAQIKQAEGKPTRVQSEAEKLLGKMGSHYALITNQTPAFIPIAGNPDGEWLGLDKGEQFKDDTVAIGIAAGIEALKMAYREGNNSQVKTLAAELGRLVRLRWNPGPERLSQFDAEVTYNRYRPVQTGRTLYLISLLLLLGALIGWAKPLRKVATIALATGFAVHIAGLVIRSYIGGRAPWSNFYESLVTITAVLVLMGLLFTIGSKLRYIILGIVAFGGFFSLSIADNAGLSPMVDTLVPALQSYWLSIHVIVILSGYAAAALAMLLGHAALGLETFKPDDRSLFIATTNAIYRAVQMAMLLLFAGTILGGVWAHEAWGRYWGWDPKETWALISWFGYLGVAHARFAGWLNPRGVALAAIGVFPLILMTYYGVNYLLSGLHSYAGGESATIPPLLIGFLIFEAIVVAVGAKGWHSHERASIKVEGAKAN
ncbi:MAG: hypothetical protein FJY67_09555 [Calditrichaeota bacterium]|nr:hypothetical protein [Calditrichota bacterium]